MFCPKCGCRIEDENAVFCPGCGLNMKQFEQEAAAMEAAAMEAAAQQAPVQEAPPVQQAPVQQASVQQAPVQEMPVQGIPPAGMPVQSAEMPAGSVPAEPLPPKKKVSIPKMNPVAAVLSVLLCLVMLVAVCAVIYRVASGARVVHIPLNQYLSVTFDGYEGQGEAKASFDRDRFLAEYSGRIKLTGKGKKLEEDATEVGKAVIALTENDTPAELLLMLFENGTLTPSEGLKNGDETVFSWNLTDSEKQALKDYLGCVPETADYVAYAEGLDDVMPVDLFEGLTLRFEGGAPNGRASIDMPATSEYANELEYKLEPEDGLKNGDTVTVTVSYAGQDLDAYLAETHGVRAEETKKEFTVEGLSAYAESYDDLTDEVIRRMDQKAMSMIEAIYDAEPDAFGNSELIPAGALFLKAQDPDAPAGFYNGVVMLYQAAVMVTQVDEGMEFTGRADYYTCVTFRDIEVDEFGASDVDLETAELTPASFVFNIPGSELVLEDGTIDWLFHELAGYETMDGMLADCDSRYGTDYSITEYIDGNAGGTGDLQQNTDENTLPEGDTQDAGPQGGGETQDGNGTLEEENPADMQNDEGDAETI